MGKIAELAFKKTTTEIIVKGDSTSTSDQAKQKADKLVAKIRSGSPFPLIAQQFSHSASAASGGDIGWVSVEQLGHELKDTVKGMSRGEVSEPVEVKGSYHIVGLRDRQGVGSLGDPIEYVSFQQVEFHFPMFGGEAAVEQTHLNASQIRSEGRSCSLMKKITKDRPRISSEMIHRRNIDQLHPELQKLFKKLKPGDRTELMNTGKGFIMFMLCNRDVVKPHEPGEDEIRMSLMDRKLSLIADRELRNLRRSAFVDIRS